MNRDYLKLRVNFLFIIVIILSLVNTSLGKDNIVQLSEFTINLLQNSKTYSMTPKLKVNLSDSWFGKDKVHHFLTSAMLSSFGYYFLRDEQSYSNKFSQMGGFGFSISLGLIKEVRDGFKPQNSFSVKDLVADMLGTLVGIAIVSDL